MTFRTMNAVFTAGKFFERTVSRRGIIGYHRLFSMLRGFLCYHITNSPDYHLQLDFKRYLL